MDHDLIQALDIITGVPLPVITKAIQDLGARDYDIREIEGRLMMFLYTESGTPELPRDQVILLAARLEGVTDL